MVNIAYIHAKDEEYSVALESKTNNDFFESCIEDMNLLQKRYENNKMFVESDVYTNDVIMEGAKEIITKFGERIRKIIDACINFVKQKVEAFQKFLWDRKDKTKVLEKLVAENPEKASKLELMIDSGKISYTDFRSISDFYKNIDEVMKEIEKGDAKSARGKLEKAKDKIEKSKDVIITTGEVIGAITAIAISVSQLLKYFKSDDKKRRDETNSVRRQTEQVGDHILETQRVVIKRRDEELKKLDSTYKGLSDDSIEREARINTRRILNNGKWGYTKNKDGNTVVSFKESTCEEFFESGNSSPQELMSVYSSTVSLYNTYSRKFINNMVRSQTAMHKIGESTINKLKGGNQ